MMQQLQEALDIGMTGTNRDQILARVKAQIDAWGVALPSTEPVVLDFGLDRFDQVGLSEFWIANEVAAGYCGKYLFVFDGQSCPVHHHLDKMETFFIVQGTVSMRLDGREIIMKPGAVCPVPPRLKHGFTGNGPSLLLELSKPCIVADNVFAHG